MQITKMNHEPKGFTRTNDVKEEAWAEISQITRPELKNSEVALIKKGLELLNDMSLGFEAAVKAIFEKLKPEQG